MESEFKQNLEKRFFYYNLPKKREIEEYQRIIKQYTNYLMQFDCIQAVYQLGNNSVPGISDIDLGIIIKDNASSNELAQINFNLPKEENYSLFLHMPFVFSEKLFQQSNLLFPHMQFFSKKILGKKIKQNKNAQIEFKVANFIDLCNVLYSKDFISEILKKQADVRYCLCRLSSLKYTLQLYTELTKDKKKAMKNIISEIIQFKLKWFENSDGNLKKQLEILKQIIFSANELKTNIIFDFATFLQEKYALNKESNWTFMNPYYYLKFLKNISVREAEKMALQTYKKKGLISTIYPLSLGDQLQIYALQKNSLGRHINSFISKKLTKSMDCLNQELYSVQNKRIHLFNEHLALLNKHHLNFGQIFNFYGINLNTGIYSKFYKGYIKTKAHYYHQILKI